MRLFENYLTGFEDVLSKRTPNFLDLVNEETRRATMLQKSSSGNQLSSVDELPNPETIQEPKVIFTYEKSYLERYFGQNPDSFSTITIGPHPDFLDLQFDATLNHHCVSVFIDIKGSTRLIEKYTLKEVRLMKDSLLTLAIHVANQFGGHVQRLQGDGIFLQFVRRNGIKNDAIINALNAASILTQFVSVDLAEILSQHDIKPIKIRTGIDFGDTEKVLWSYYGIPNCKELTTTSLHTDMAAKLQAKAFDNSILIGGNVKEILDLKKEFCLFYETQENKERVYYISSQYSYPFFVFDWKQYLLSLPFVSKKSNGEDLEIKDKHLSIECFIADSNGENSERYYPNSKSIPKGKKIIFKLMRGNSQFVKQPFENIEWIAFNSGKEAEGMKQLKHDFDKKYVGSSICETDAAYLGHHYVECRVIRQNSENERICFPVFVQ